MTATDIRPRRSHRFHTREGISLPAADLVVRYALLCLVTIISIGPFLWQLATSLKGLQDNPYSSPPQFLPGHPTLANYASVADLIPVWRYAGNSVIVAAGNVGLTVVGTALAGFALACLNFRGRRLALGVFIAALLIPGEAGMISLLQMMRSLGLTNTLVAVFLPGSISALSVLLMRNAFSAQPVEIHEAAIIDGANAWKRFWHIGLPAVRGTLAVVALLAFMGSWNDFLWPLLVLSEPDKYTLSVGLNYLNGAFAGNPRVVAAGTIIAVAPIVVLFLMLQRVFFRGIGEGAIKG